MGTHQKLGRVRNQGEQRDAEKLFVNLHTLQHNINSINKNLGNNGVENSGTHQDDGTLESAPVGRVMAAMATSLSSCRLAHVLVVRESRCSAQRVAWRRRH